MKILTTNDPVMEADGDLIKLGDLGAEYILPKASASTLGGVKVGDNLDIESDGTLNAEGYTLPPATAETLGGIKVGDNLTVEEDGTLNAEGYTLPAATAETLGGVKIGSGVSVGEDGTISVEGGGGIEPLGIIANDTYCEVLKNNSVAIGGIGLIDVTLHLTVDLPAWGQLCTIETDASKRTAALEVLQKGNMLSTYDSSTQSYRDFVVRKNSEGTSVIITTEYAISFNSYKYIRIIGMCTLDDVLE